MAVGSTVTNEGQLEKHRVLAEVVGVGMIDVFLREEGERRVFKMPKTRCILMNDREVNTGEDTLTPKIGDLVMSMSDRFGTLEKKMGVLVEITDVPGRSKTAKILKGEKTEFASFDTLIVLERN